MKLARILAGTMPTTGSGLTSLGRAELDDRGCRGVEGYRSLVPKSWVDAQQLSQASVNKLLMAMFHGCGD